MAIEFDGKGNIVGTTPDGAIAVKFYSLEKQIAELKSQLQQKENIIKEVREYINDNVMVYAFNDKKFPHWDFNDDNINDILEILDKEKENG